MNPTSWSARGRARAQHTSVKTWRRPVAVASATALLTCGVGVALSVAHASTAAKFTANVVASAPLPPGRHYTTTRSAVEIDDLEIAPGASSGWHAHSGPLLLIVRRGTLTNYIAHGTGCVRHVFRAGQSYLEPAHHAHLARNEGKTKLVVYAVNNFPKGTPSAIEAKRPIDCHV